MPPDISPAAETSSTASPDQTRQRIDAGRTNRSLAFLAAGTLAGLILSGYALFTARGTSTFAVPAEDVAVVNQQPISRTDFLAQLQTLYNVDFAHATAKQRRTALDGMIREELFVQRGKELDVASVDADVRTAMVTAVGQIVAADAIVAVPEDAQLRAYYNAHRDAYASEGTMLADDIVFTDADDAEQARKALTAGTPAGPVMARFGGKPSGKLDGEEFYFAARIHLGDALFSAARALADGAISSPVTGKDGVHVIVMHKNRKPPPFALSEVRGQVLTDYRNDRIQRMQADEERFLRKRANILVSEDLR